MRSQDEVLVMKYHYSIQVQQGMPLWLLDLSPLLPGASVFEGKLPLKNKSSSPNLRAAHISQSFGQRNVILRSASRKGIQPQGAGELAAALCSGSLMFGCAGTFSVVWREMYLVLFQLKLGSRGAVGGFFMSLRWAESSQVSQSVLPTISRAVSDWRFFLASSDDSHELSFLFVYCLVFIHYSSVLFFISCKKMKNIISTFPFSLALFNLFFAQGFTDRKAWNSLGSLEHWALL